MRAWLHLRYTVPQRREAFDAGLKRLGFHVIHGITAKPKRGDVLVTWNRIGKGDGAAKAFESMGLPVLVTENASWGNDFAGKRWYTIARNRHNTAGMFDIGDDDRWDSLGIHLPRFRTKGETVILPQRGIGAKPTAMPVEWPKRAHKAHGGRLRKHPGRSQGITLKADLKHCGKVITWGSGAAVKALMMGIPVISDMPGWIAEQDNTEPGRLDMFRRLAWAQWTMEEIESGEAFHRLL